MVINLLAPFEALNDDVVILIFQKLDSKNRIQIERVSDRFRRLVQISWSNKRTFHTDRMHSYCVWKYANLDSTVSSSYYITAVGQVEPFVSTDALGGLQFSSLLINAVLPRFRNLTTFRAEKNETLTFADSDLSKLAECCPRLERLHFNCVTVDEHSFAFLCKFERLKKFVLWPYVRPKVALGLPNSSTLIGHLKNAFDQWRTTLKCFSFCIVDHEAVELINFLPESLTALKVVTQCRPIQGPNGSQVDAARRTIKAALVKFLKTHPNLKFFYSGICDCVVDESFLIENISTLCPNIQGFHFATAFSTAYDLSGLKNLTELGFDQCKSLAIQEHAENLYRTLDSVKCTLTKLWLGIRFSNFLIALPAGFRLPRLTNLRLTTYYDTSAIRIYFFDSLLIACPNLTKFRLSNYDHVTLNTDHLAVLGKRCRRLTTVRFNGQISSPFEDSLCIAALALNLWSADSVRKADERLTVFVKWPEPIVKRYSNLIQFNRSIEIVNLLTNW